MKSLTLFLLFYYPYSILCQDFPRKELDMNRITDELYGFQDSDANYEELYENVLQLLSNPVNLNKAKEEDLRFLNLLSNRQIRNLLDYRKENKNFLSIYELQAIPEFDLHTINKLAPFVKVTDPATILDASFWKKIRKETDNYFLVRYERTLQTRIGNRSLTQPGYRFKGSSDKLYFRFRSSRPGDFSVGFTAEKDAGEAVHWSAANHYYGLDYLSFHFQLQNKGRLKNLVIGDFQSQFGQGLMLGGILGMGKGSETITTARRSNIGILPYTSVYEAGFFRGMAGTVEITEHFNITAFYSNTKRDATTSEDSISGSVVSSFQTTGLHRNENELSTRKKIGDQNWGAVLQYKVNQLDLGVMFNEASFDAPVLRNRNAYNQFAFEGFQNKNIGLFLNYTFLNLAFFSEASHTISNGNAVIAGVLWSLTNKLDLSLLYRKFDRNFYSFYSNAFAENSLTQNESGMYWGCKYSINQKINMAGYLDLFQFPWLRYRNYAPSSGHEWLIRFTYQPTRKVMIFVQGREESKDRNMTDENSTLFHTSNGKKYNYWINIDYGIRQKLRLKTRVQFSSFRFAGRHSKGTAILQDIRTEFGKFKFTVRYALFDTDDYDNRQYVYENDVYLAYAMPAYYSVGVRKVAMIEYKMNHNISLWLRCANTRYLNENTIGSGLETIEGNTKTDIKFQLRITF
ncbi:MAG: helix-hairpin-helix domain-containing protein [Cyclobacteriaceae bacterium]|nr:helix-hairpin-helix domain-containing protein [Cyclobacteriaceae bacterium]